jgi:hypothetical protein
MSRIRLSALPPREKPGVEIAHSRAEGLFLKFALGGLFGFILLIAVVWAGHGVYVRWQEKRLVRQAETALQENDIATASLASRAVLQLKPDSLPAQRIAAAISERANDSGAVIWRRKVVDSPGHTGEDMLNLAQCALQFNDIATLHYAITAFSEADRETSGYHAVAAMVAQADNQNDKAIGEWEQAVRRSPEDKGYQLQLGTAEFRSTNPSRRQLGQATLNMLRNDEKYRTAVTRVLITQGVAQHQSTGKILQLAGDLTTYPDATFADRLLAADIFRQTNSPQFASFLTDLEKRALDRSQDLASLLSWMSAANLNVLAVDYIRTIKPELLQTWPVPLALADIYVRLKEWSKLEAATKSVDWRGSDFLRHAYLARAFREQDKPAAAENEWSAATKAAGASSEETVALFRTASSWGWRNEEIELLWALTKHADKEKDGFQALYKHYLDSHDTQGLYRVLVRLADDLPDNLDLQNNFAQVSLLLNAEPDNARRLAADVYHKHPDNAAYTTTYAYALLTKGDGEGAVKVMSSLSADQLKDPAVAAYYGICLAAVNDPRAAEYLEIGKNGLFLPEEKALLAKARAQVAPNKN